jgi:thiamine biosynthesis protein ThiS
MTLQVLAAIARQGKPEGAAAMQVQLNGEPFELAEGATVADLVRALGGDPRGIAIERNLEIVPKSRHGATCLEEGDRLEVVQFVGGG